MGTHTPPPHVRLSRTTRTLGLKWLENISVTKCPLSGSSSSHFPFYSPSLIKRRWHCNCIVPELSPEFLCLERRIYLLLKQPPPNRFCKLQKRVLRCPCTTSTRTSTIARCSTSPDLILTVFTLWAHQDQCQSRWLLLVVGVGVGDIQLIELTICPYCNLSLDVIT